MNPNLLLAFLIMSVTLAGCLGGTDGDGDEDMAGGSVGATVNADLPLGDATGRTVNADGSVTLNFTVETTGGASVIAGSDAGEMVETFSVDDSVAMVRFYSDLVDGETIGRLAGALIDGEGRAHCGVATYQEGSECSAPVTADNTGTWSLEFETVWRESKPDQTFSVYVDLLPPPAPPLQDPLAGTDPSITFRTSVTGFNAGEDNVGVLPDGTLFVQNGGNTLRSSDDGETWENVSPGDTSQPSFDPMLYVDPYRERVYVDHLTVGCSNLFWSDDAGETWVANPTACGAPANDHQKISSGPNPVEGNPMPAAYYSYSSFGAGSYVSFSYDGGVTWVTREVWDPTNSENFWAENPQDGEQPNYCNTGPVHADESGNVYVPYYMSDHDGYMAVGVSHDFGQTWTTVLADPQPAPCYDPDAGLYTDTAGNVYLAYHRGDKGIFYVWSGDHGLTWSDPIRVSPAGLQSFVHVDMVAGDEGRIAIAYRATPDSNLGPNSAHGLSQWFMYTTFVTEANTQTPTVQTAFAQDPVAQDPIQRGPICTNGVACVAGRNLLDFIDVQVGPDGRVYTVYSDGCIDNDCPTPADSRGRAGTVAIQEDGPRLFVDKAPWAA